MPNSSKVTFGINVIGYVSSNVSLGIVARHFIQLFKSKNIPIATYDLKYNQANNFHEGEHSSLTVAQPSELPYSINLFLVALWELPELLLWPQDGLFTPERVNAALIWHEPTYLQPRYRQALGLMDVLLAGSEYVRAIFSTQVSDTLTIGCKHPIYLPKSVVCDREKFGLPRDPVLFIQSFDPHNDLNRKNPFAAIDAFFAAFGTSNEANLILKLNNASVKTDICDPDEIVRDLKVRCNNDSRIHIIAESLPYSDVISLYASCDVFISLHRAEGLGLGMLECMVLGKPVIATAWSGNMSFMKHSNSCLVGYDLVPFSGLGTAGKDMLGDHAVWADPHIDEAADWMQKLVNDPELRLRIGTRAKQDANVYLQEADQASFVEELQAIVQERTFITRRNYCKWKRIDSLRKEFEHYYFNPLKRTQIRLRRAFDRTIGWRYK